MAPLEGSSQGLNLQYMYVTVLQQEKCPVSVNMDFPLNFLHINTLS